MGTKHSSRTNKLDTHSIRLLRERIPDFTITEYVDRWRRYKVGSQLGRGAMGIVYQALDTELQREVALKCVETQSENDNQSIERFLDEIQIHARLTHPSIAPIYDFGLTPDGHLFMSMEIVFGESLEKIVDYYHNDNHPKGTKIHLTDILNRFISVCDALNFAHRMGVIHRDLKPENIICGEFGEVFVMDWGLATIILSDQHENQKGSALLEVTVEERKAAHNQIRREVERRIERHTRKLGLNPPEKDFSNVSLVHRSLSGSIVGTIGYMAPEQALGRADKVNKYSDTYSLGCILYHLLCGKAPIEITGEDVWESLNTIIDGRIVAPIERSPRKPVPKELSNIAVKALSRDPQNRFADAGQLRRAVQDWIRQQAMASYVISDVEDALENAQTRLREGQPEHVQLLLKGTTGRLKGIEGSERLISLINRTLKKAKIEMEERDERDQAFKSFHEIHGALIESQFGLILSYLRLPAPTIRRAHDRLYKVLSESGLLSDPRKVLEQFERFQVSDLESGTLAGGPKQELIFVLFLFSWVSLRMALVTSEEHGKQVFLQHAEIAVNKLDQLAPDYRSPKLNLSRLEDARGNHKKAKQLRDLAEETPISNPNDQIYLATIHFFDYQLEEALQHIDEALANDPGAFWGHALLTFIYNGLGNKAASFASLRTCQALQPYQPILWTIRGFLLREYGEFEEAHEALDKALRYGPYDPLARLIRADLRLRLRRIDWERDLDKAADLVTPPKQTWDYFVLALIALYKHDTVYALEFVKAAQKRSPGMPQLYGLEASVWMRQEEYERAEKLLRKALEMSPNDPRLSESLLSLLLAQERYDEARKKFQADQKQRPRAATPNVLLLAARASAGLFKKAESKIDKDRNEVMALKLFEQAARSGVISRQEVDTIPEFSAFFENQTFQNLLPLLREGPSAPRLFQPALGDTIQRNTW